MAAREISADFPFESRYVEVRGANIHYVEEGTGDPVLFVHGNPTWSYLWRNILPQVAVAHRAIAFDLLGFGRSDKPGDADYSFDEHCAVLKGFIESLDLRNLSLVLHDWGGPIGMNYAVDHKENVAKVVLMSTFVAPVKLPLGFALKLLRVPWLSAFMIQRLNLFLPIALRVGVANRSHLTREVLRQYYAPFPDYESRRSIRRWPEQLPLGPADSSYRALERISAALPSFDRPVLVLKAERDPILTMKRAKWLIQTLPSARLEVVEKAGHYAQEDQPEKVAAAISQFLVP
ncbi:MAG: haloalkane dehalogenase [Chloroflexi bacterium]|nr:haloalkane dehalogenase [Chloroflexota bacterium]